MKESKQAIKARCRDCLAGMWECTFTDCALKTKGIIFDEPPRIGHRDDALALLDQLIEADYVEGLGYVLEALRDAIDRWIV